MRKKPRQQVKPDTVRNLCLALLESLAKNPLCPNDAYLAPLATLKDGTILTMFCVIRFWALDSLARLSGIGAVTDWEKKFEELMSALSRINKSHLLELANRTRDGISVSFLTVTLDALWLVGPAIEKRLRRRPIGKAYVAFRDTKSEERLNKILQEISPKSSYYHIPGDEPEDRRSYIHVGFLDFIEKLKEAPLADWDHFPHTVLGEHRPVPHPEWNEKAAEYLKRDIESTLKEDLPILSGELDNAPLQMRTVTRDIYSSRYYGINPRTTPTPKEVDINEISPSKMIEEPGAEFNPEVLLADKLSRQRQGRQLDQLREDDPELFLIMRNEAMDEETKRVNKKKVAEELRISRPTLDERIKKRRNKINKLIK